MVRKVGIVSSSLHPSFSLSNPVDSALFGGTETNLWLQSTTPPISWEEIVDC